MKALIVDDSMFIRDYLRQHLERMGVACSDVDSGEAALQILVAHQFDVMMLDVNMGGMSGLQCVKRLRDERMAPRMKVMMVTTEADNSFINRALEYGADEFLMKPFTPQSLREKLVLLGLEVA